MLSILLIAFLVILIFFSAFMSASETAFFSLSTYTVKNFKRSNNAKEQAIAKLLERPRELLVTLMILNVGSNILVQNTVSNLFGSFTSWLVKVGIPLLLILFFGEVIPKSIALPNNVMISKCVVSILDVITKVLTPIRRPLTKLTSIISRLLFFFLKKEKLLTNDELEHILSTSHKKGILDVDEVELVEGYLDLKEAIVKEKMIPRSDIVFYDINSPLSLLINMFVDKEISRIPVCDKEIDNPIGVISAKTYFLYASSISNNMDIKNFIKKPFYVPESTKAWSLLSILREKKENVAIVVDEYGTITGIITKEDLVASLIGNIEDVRDCHSNYTSMGSDSVIASGKMTLEEFYDVFDVDLPTVSNMVTLGGWLIEQLEDIPQDGTKHVFNDFLFYVLSSDPNCVKKIYIRRIKHKRRGEKK
jgi:putative hemolysin